MGSARWDAADWARYASAAGGKTTDALFASRFLSPALDPRGARIRESRDSTPNPNSNTIIVALDVTGSMGMIADALARRGLGTLVEETLRRKPVSDPHVMVMGVGDAHFDRAPLQVTQFEADIRIAQQLEMLWLEKGGGGNTFESYHLPWYFAATHVAMDCWEKRGRRGYLFTVGDEDPPGDLLAEQVRRVVGDDLERDLSARDLLLMASRMFHVFHVIVEEGSYARREPAAVHSRWAGLMGQRVLRLSDHTRLAEVVVSAIEINEGRDRDGVASSWSGSTSLVVARAVGDLARGRDPRPGVIRL